MKKSQSKPFKVRIISSLMRCFAWLSTPIANGIMNLVYNPAVWFNSKTYRVSKRNIEHCLPELSQKERVSLAKKSLKHTLQLFPEISKIWIRPCIADWIAKVYGEQALLDDLANNKSVMITGAHIGNWEVALFYLGKTFDFRCMYRQPRYQEMDEIICQGRCKNTTKMIPGDAKGLRQFLKALNSGCVAALLSDQEPGGDTGIYAPFFGQPAKSMDLIQKIQQKTDANLYQIAAIKKGRQKYDIHLIRVPINEIEDPIEYVTLVNKELEMVIRRFPEQYQWSYKRFKSTVDGTKNIYNK